MLFLLLSFDEQQPSKISVTARKNGQKNTRFPNIMPPKDKKKKDINPTWPGDVPGPDPNMKDASLKDLKATVLQLRNELAQASKERTEVATDRVSAYISMDFTPSHSASFTLPHI